MTKLWEKKSLQKTSHHMVGLVVDRHCLPCLLRARTSSQPIRSQLLIVAQFKLLNLTRPGGRNKATTVRDTTTLDLNPALLSLKLEKVELTLLSFSDC